MLSISIKCFGNPHLIETMLKVEIAPPPESGSRLADRGSPSLLFPDRPLCDRTTDIKDLDQVNNPGMIDPEYSIHIPDNKSTINKTSFS